MKILYAAAAIFLALGCGSAPTQVVTGAPGRRDVIFDAEIQSRRVAGMTAYELVSHLRPEYLKSRGASTFRDTMPPTAIVYVDNVKYGSLDQMKNLSAEHVFQVQYLSGSDATTRFGLDHGGGAILITTK